MTAELPGYRVVDTAAAVAEDGLRNDVAAFLGSTERGPLNLAVRVAGRQADAAIFGGPANRAGARGAVPDRLGAPAPRSGPGSGARLLLQRRRGRMGGPSRPRGFACAGRARPRP